MDLDAKIAFETKICNWGFRIANSFVIVP